ncbi:hypothetical protein MA16_Dca027583 [Dendrobium catenatum]|uniref:TRAPPC10/Trs130 C-terminal domain-containing protein n=1 Tax=Dendrobium catenatum TaxID=906689 RepID=A0A2I0W8B8_9ASPA|nr:hypothetical protein MA16_Dca027583 [Dendrobium catenatum]
MHTCQQDKFTEIASSFKALRHDDQKLASALVEKQGEKSESCSWRSVGSNPRVAVGDPWVYNWRSVGSNPRVAIKIRDSNSRAVGDPKTDSFFPLDETEVVKTESILNIKYGIEGDRAVGAHIPVNIKPEGQDELLFKIALPLQRPVLDPCLAVGFLPFTFDCLRVGQLVDMKWRLERLKDPEEIQSFLSKDELLYEIDANPENWMIAGRKRGHISLAATQGSRVVITVSCLPLVSGYVRPPQLGLPGVAESNISCNPAGPHLVCVLPPTLSSSFCILNVPGWSFWSLNHPDKSDSTGEDGRRHQRFDL